MRVPAGVPLATGTNVVLSPHDAAHAARVLRLSEGDRVILCDGRGHEYEAILERVSPRQTTARIHSYRVSTAEPSVFVTLMQGIAKGGKMDLIIQKAVEVGVSRIIPVITERAVVRLDEAKAEARIERWQRIAYEAAKQAGRAIVPTVEPVVSWLNVWTRDDLGFVIVPWEGEREHGLLKTVQQLIPGAAPDEKPAATIVIGPEGGLTSDEIALARKHGAHAVTLGPRILRTETAGLVAAALVLGALGDLG